MATKRNKFIDELSKPIPGKNRFTDYLESQIEDKQYKMMQDYLGDYFDKRDLDMIMDTLTEDYDRALTEAAISAAANSISGTSSGTTSAPMGPPGNAYNGSSAVPNTIINGGSIGGGYGWNGNYNYKSNDVIVDGTLSADDIKVGDKKLSHVLDKIQERLGILDDPSPEKLEKFAALKKAYEQYKILENLCYEQEDTEDK